MVDWTVKTRVEREAAVREMVTVEWLVVLLEIKMAQWSDHW